MVSGRKYWTAKMVEAGLLMTGMGGEKGGADWMRRVARSEEVGVLEEPWSGLGDLAGTFRRADGEI